MKNKGQQMGLFDVFDMEIASFLGIEVLEYIERIEKLSEYRMQVLVLGFLSSEEEEQEKAKKIFNTYVL